MKKYTFLANKNNNKKEPYPKRRFGPDLPRLKSYWGVKPGFGAPNLTFIPSSFYKAGMVNRSIFASTNLQ